MITMREISRRLNMDYSTVSRILNRDFERHKYREETIEKVTRFAREHNFQKDRAAASLRGGKTLLVGLSIAELANPYFASLASLINAELSRHNYRTIIADNRADPEMEAKNIKDFLSYRVDGMILSLTTRKQPLRKLAPGAPIVTLDYDWYAEYDFVGIDNAAVATALTGLLKKKKRYRKIGLVTHVASEARVNYFMAAAAPEIETLAPPPEMRDERFLETQCAYFLEQGCDALIGLFNRATMAILGYAWSRGLVYPKVIGIAGVDDFELADKLNPGITVIRQPLKKFAAKITDVMIKNIECPTTGGRRFLFPGELIERGSL